MNKDIEKLADDCGFYILNSPMWRQQGERFLIQLLSQRGSDGEPLVNKILRGALTPEEAERFVR